MVFQYRGSSIYYHFYNRRTEVVNVFLHGWGLDHKSLNFCKDALFMSSLYIDFPPFGRSDKNIKDWSIFTYAAMVIALCDSLNIKKMNVFGHSFGGRVAILFSVFNKNKVKKLVLIDSAGLKPRRKISYYFKVISYKIRKRLRLDTSKCGSCDYLALNGDMRKVFSSVVKTYLDDFLAGISAKTLIIFGKNDKVTPLYMAKRLHRKIKNSELCILEGAGHFCFNDKRYLFLRKVTTFVAGG